jgi:DNA-binding NtrC family response regulator
MTSGFLLAWRDVSQMQSVFVPCGGRAVEIAGTVARPAENGVSVGGVQIREGFPACVDGRVISCLSASEGRYGERVVRLGKMSGSSDAMIEVMHQTASAGLTREPVLILGESGTGKELVADYLGSVSGSMHAVNLAAVPIELAEAELFGWVRGAFTGAVDSRPGALESARKGVLFLDEVADAPAWVQVKLLRALESRSFRRLGASREIALEARLVAATNVDPVDGVASGRLRLDLLERLACHVIRIAPLRARPADLPCLINHFAAEVSPGLRDVSRPVNVSADVVDVMRRWPWQGNVRELKNVVTRVLMLSGRGLENPSLVREALEAGRFFRNDAAFPGVPAESVATSRYEEIAESSLPRSTYYYRLKRGRIPSDSGPRRAPTSAALKI